MKSTCDIYKVIYLIVTLIVSVLVAYFAHPLIKNNTEAINILVTTFSILVGFLLAIITLVGDPKALPIGSWRVAELACQTTFNRLNRQKLLFYVYLTTLILIFISALIKTKFELINYYIEIFYLFFASISIMYSFKLPAAIIGIQKERIDCEIAERRKIAGINDNNTKQ